MDIGSKAPYPASALSNFAPHAFEFDGVHCASMEGLIQSFKFEDHEVQKEVCRLVGKEAKLRGNERNEAWKSAQKLWWKGIAYDREGPEYQKLVDRAFQALSTSQSFREVLLLTKDEVLTHVMGNPNPKETTLTEREFCDRLMKVRAELQK